MPIKLVNRSSFLCFVITAGIQGGDMVTD